MCASFPLFLFVSCSLQTEHRGSRALLPRPPWKVNKGPILTEGSVTRDCKMTLTVLTVTLQSKLFIDSLDCDSSLPQKAQKPGVTVQTVKQLTSLQPNLFVWRKENKRHLSMITTLELQMLLVLYKPVTELLSSASSCSKIHLMMFTGTSSVMRNWLCVCFKCVWSHALLLHPPRNCLTTAVCLLYHNYHFTSRPVFFPAAMFFFWYQLQFIFFLVCFLFLSHWGSGLLVCWVGSYLPTSVKHKMRIISDHFLLKAVRESDRWQVLYLQSPLWTRQTRTSGGKVADVPPACWTAVLMAWLLFVIIIRLNNSCNRHSRGSVFPAAVYLQQQKYFLWL